MLKLCRSLHKATEQSELSADWDDLQTLKWAQTIDPHQSEECELLLETYSMQVCLSFLFWTCSFATHMFKLPQREQTNVLNDASMIEHQGQAEMLSSAEQHHWCKHLWHGGTCDHQRNSLQLGAVLAVRGAMLQTN